MRGRLAFLFLIFIVLAGIVFARLVDLHYIRAEKLSNDSEKQSIVEREIKAERGKILDSNGDVLALSTKRYKILGKPFEMGDAEDIDYTLKKLHSVIDFDIEEVSKKLKNSPEQDIFIAIVKDLTKTERNLVSDVVTNFGLTGIVFDDIPTRIYPFHTLSAPVVGLTNREGNGYLGIEQYYNDYLSGTDGLEKFTADADTVRKPLPNGYYHVVPPENGKDIYLTQNSAIQFFVEQTAQKTYEELSAKSVSVIVTGVEDNKILAMASVPTFNLSDPFNHDFEMTDKEWNTLTDQEKTNYYYQKRWVNRPVSTIYEPGSTMKTIMTAIALEEGLVNEASEFVCNGYRVVADQELHCVSYPYGHGTQFLGDAFCNSCNVAFMEISQRIGKKKLYEYFEKLHLLDKTGVDLPSEASPFFVEEELVGPVEVATLGYGHGISVNMLQMVSAISAIVNDGVYYPPYIATDKDGKPLSPIAGKGERVFSVETSRKVREFMEKQADRSILKNSSVRIGGKSGTTVKVVNGAYDDECIISSYIAYAPIDNPKYCVYIVIDEPDINLGLTTMYPPVKKILLDIFRMYAINTDTVEETVIVPDLSTLSVARAREVAGWCNLTLSTNPDMLDEASEDEYIVNDQFPKAGTSVKNGFVIIVDVEHE